MAIYKGFSSINKRGKYHLTDFALVRQDLYNHLYTKKGERIMNPNFGCIIWNLLYEPLTDQVKDAIVENLKEIVALDPRISADSIIVSEYEHGIMVQLEIRYLQTNEVARMQVEFDQQKTPTF